MKHILMYDAEHQQQTRSDDKCSESSFPRWPKKVKYKWGRSDFQKAHREKWETTERSGETSGRSERQQRELVRLLGEVNCN